MLDFSTFDFSKRNISCNKDFFKCRTDIVLFGYFQAGTRKSYCAVVFYICTLKFFKTKFRPKIKILKFGTKIDLAGYFGLEFQKLVLFEISIFEFVNMQSFIQKQKTLNLGPKIPYLCIFALKFNKNHYQIFNQHP